MSTPASAAHIETPLHWAASCNDVAALDALLDAGADIEAPGAVIAGGPPLADARAFRNREAALRLVERGARTTLTDAATLGLMDRLEAACDTSPPPPSEEISRAFWGACHGDQHRAALYLLDRGAELNWLPTWERLTPLDAARRSNAVELARCLRDLGARSADELAQLPARARSSVVKRNTPWWPGHDGSREESLGVDPCLCGARATAGPDTDLGRRHPSPS